MKEMITTKKSLNFRICLISDSTCWQLINEINFSAFNDGLYILKDGREFKVTTLEGHLKNNIGGYGKIKCVD